MKQLTKLINETQQEFKRVEWPTQEETKRLTAYVIGVSLVVSLFVAGADLLFTEVLSLII